MLGKLILTALALQTFALAKPAQAAVTVTTYDFTATTPGFGDEVYSGSLDVAFDDATMLFSLVGIDFAIGSTAFNLSNTGLNTDTFLTPDPVLGFTVGGTLNTIGAITHMTDDFTLVYLPSLSMGSFDIAQAGLPGIQSVDTSSGFVITEVEGAIPEPTTWAMLLIGFGAIGFLLRRSAKDDRNRRVLNEFSKCS